MDNNPLAKGIRYRERAMQACNPALLPMLTPPSASTPFLPAIQNFFPSLVPPHQTDQRPPQAANKDSDQTVFMGPTFPHWNSFESSSNTSY